MNYTHFSTEFGGILLPLKLDGTGVWGGCRAP